VTRPVQSIGVWFRAQGVVQAMRHGDYARYVTTSWVALVGFWMQRIAIGWLTWEETRSGAWLGAVALGNSLPAFVLVPFAGAIADRMDRLKLLRMSHGSQVLVSAALAASTLAGFIDIWQILILSTVHGILESIATPSRMTIAPGLVPRDDLSSAVALNAVAFNSATFAGPAIAAWVIAETGIGVTFVICGFLFLPHYWVLFRIHLRRTEHVPGGGGGGLLSDIFDALAYIFRHKGIGPILLAATIGALTTRHLPELMPGFVGAIFEGGPGALGVLVSGYGAGGMLGAFLMANRNRIQGTTWIFFIGLLGNGVFVFLFSLTSVFALGLAAVTLFGFSMSTSGNGAQILLHNAVEGSLRARVMSLYSLTFRGGPALGAMLFGALSEAYGLQIPVAAGALCCIAGGLWVMRRRLAITEALEGAG
jgi:MFS family permease